MFPPFLSSALLLYIQCLETLGAWFSFAFVGNSGKAGTPARVAEGATCPVCHRAPGPLAHGGRRAGAVLGGMGVPGPSAFPARSFWRVEGLDLEGSLA